MLASRGCDSLPRDLMWVGGGERCMSDSKVAYNDRCGGGKGRRLCESFQMRGQ